MGHGGAAHPVHGLPGHHEGQAHAQVGRREHRGQGTHLHRAGRDRGPRQTRGQ